MKRKLSAELAAELAAERQAEAAENRRIIRLKSARHDDPAAAAATSEDI